VNKSVKLGRVAGESHKQPKKKKQAVHHRWHAYKENQPPFPPQHLFRRLTRYGGFMPKPLVSRALGVNKSVELGRVAGEGHKQPKKRSKADLLGGFNVLGLIISFESNVAM
jgi:hypothetical protein